MRLVVEVFNRTFSSMVLRYRGGLGLPNPGNNQNISVSWAGCHWFVVNPSGES